MSFLTHRIVAAIQQFTFAEESVAFLKIFFITFFFSEVNISFCFLVMYFSLSLNHLYLSLYYLVRLWFNHILLTII